MKQENAIKKKMISIYTFLKKETDKDHPISTKDLCSRMDDVGIHLNRRNIPQEMNLLIEQGYDVKTEKRGKENFYYLDHSRWKTGEIKMLIDAVQAARFISQEDTENLIKHLIELGDEDGEYILKKHLVNFNTIKYGNSEVQSNIEILENALADQKKVSFKYFDLDENKKMVFRRNGERYLVEPISLVYYEDFYYLLTWNAKHSSVVIYRIDRISDVAEEKKKVGIGTQKLISSSKIEDLNKKSFKMFMGKEKKMRIEFDKQLLGAVYDKFGTDINIFNTSENKLSTDVVIMDSPTWKGWLSQFEGKMIAMEKG